MSEPFELEWFKRDAKRPEDWSLEMDFGTQQGLWLSDTVFLEFTGLLDKKNKEIYEGDIVDTWHRQLESGSEWTKWEKYPDGRGEVQFDFQDFGWRVSCPTNFCPTFRPSDTGRLFEILGNIYQNPQLIKGEIHA